MIDVIDYGNKYEGRSVVCLGGYESLHLGHARIISLAKGIALKNSASVVLMLFDYAFDGCGKLLLDFDERVRRAEELGVDCIMRVRADEQFFKTTHGQFLQTLADSFDLSAVVCGEDFRFGSNRTGDLSVLARFCDGQACDFFVAKDELLEGGKISTTRIKALLNSGEVGLANAMLGYNYFISGRVEMGRQVGGKIGFPTANISAPKGRFLLKSGVYHTKTSILGRQYDCITNVGSAPTFNESALVIETHVKGFEGNLYGEELCIEFIKRIRDTVKFSSVEELTDRLKKDLELAK